MMDSLHASVHNLNLIKINLKTYQFITQCNGVICHPFKIAKIIVFDPMKYKGPKVP